jgi:hypothetical protein
VVYRGPKRIDFMPKAWLEWLPNLGIKDGRGWIFVHIREVDELIGYSVAVGPMRDLEKRKDIATKLLAESDTFGFKRSKAKKLSDNWSVIAPGERLGEWGEDETPDQETLRAAVNKRLDDLYPKLEKLAKVLKPLCKRLASAT